MQKDFITFLKEKASIVDIISRRVKLSRSGKDWMGLCPFHSEKTASFKVDSENGYYYCFGCGAHGDIITFVMESEKVIFSEAIEIIANMNGIQIPKNDQSSKTNENIYIYSLLEKIKNIFALQLNSNVGAVAIEYLKSRNISNEFINKFHLGFSSKKISIINELKKHNFSEEIIMKSGVFYRRKQTGNIVNRFDERIIFPIIDSSGRCVGFGGRTIGKAEGPKYINSPESDVFVKNRHLYGYNLAKKTTSKKIIIVEGYMDVISMHQAGFDGAVAPLGTSISETQINMCWNITNNPTVALDGDEAGIKASYRWIDKILPSLIPGKSFGFARLPQGTDPDSLIQAQQKNIIMETIENTTSLSEWLWDGAFYMYPSTTPEQKAALVEMILKKIDLIKDLSIKKLYKRYIKLKELEFYKTKQNASKNIPNIKPIIPVKEKTEKILIVTLINHPYIIDRFIESFIKIEFKNAYMSKLKNKIVDIYSSYFAVNNEVYIEEMKKFRDNIFDLINEVTLYANFSSEKINDDDALDRCYKIYEKYLSDSAIAVDLQNASISLESSFSEDNWRRLKALKKESLFNNHKIREN